ncbi:MAG: MBL fold metallo-hydrolase [Chloroflexi bacterium]|nr:MBL fold metallo-hydrolase [Chloroflexota bacterium]
MHVRAISLASGSSGNALLVQAGETNVLIDAGVTARRIVFELKRLGLAPEDLDALFLTHEHGDHVGAAGALSRRHHVTVVANEQTLDHAGLGSVESHVQPTGTTLDVGDLAVTSFPLPHDGIEPVGYLLEHRDCKILVATDLGYAPASINEYVHACDLIVLESNHDLNRLVHGPYSSALKSRIIGYTGHLSNEQCAECVVACASGRPQWLWLAHLSEVNNSPRRALKAIKQRLRDAGITSVQVGVALRDKRSVVWGSSECWVQPRLL